MAQIVERKSKMEKCGRESVKLENILSDKQLHLILSKTASPGVEVIAYDIKPANSGMIGFLGDHLRLTLHVKEEFVKKIYLFIKTLPLVNQPKVDMIKQNYYYEREALIYKLLEEMGNSNDKDSWHPKALIYADNILVMPDLCVEGYKSYSLDKTFDKYHVIATMTSIARFHAEFSNHVTLKTKIEGRPYNFLDDHDHIITEPIFRNCPWLYAAAKLTSDYLKELSTHSKEYPDDLEEQLTKVYIKACESLKVYDDTFNVIIHKDLWSNNILFKYSGNVVTNAMLIDFQCFRYAPPAFDIMQFLYFNTSRKFRKCHEREVLQHYYSVFMESLNDDTKRRLEKFNYDLETFISWCETARLFGMMEAATILPFVLMDAEEAQKNFDDPKTLMSRLNEDRSAPVIQYARVHDAYKHRQLDICEEIVEKYILKD